MWGEKPGGCGGEDGVVALELNVPRSLDLIFGKDPIRLDLSYMSRDSYVLKGLGHFLGCTPRNMTIIHESHLLFNVAYSPVL